MSLKKRFKFFRTLAFRLTLWYAGIFSVSSGIAFLLLYLFINAALQNGIDRELLSRSQELSSLLHFNGVEAVKRVLVLEAQAAGEKKIFVRLLHPNGDTFSSSNMSYWKDIAISRAALTQISQTPEPILETASIPHLKHKVRILYSLIGPATLLQLGQSMENQTRFFEAFQRIFISVSAILIIFSALIGWVMARRATRGVERVTNTARYIAEGAMDQRVPVGRRDDEIDQLAQTFNHMLDRIQSLLANIKEISDNIAHDLRSPITRIRGLAEVTLTTGDSETGYEAMAASTIEECDRLLHMINTMLAISKTEAGFKTQNQDVMEIGELARQACELFSPMAEDKNISLTCETENEYRVKGDIPMIQRVISNLLDNAVKYTPSGGAVHVRCRSEDHSALVEIVDTGTGISSNDLPRIFDRFYRCDQSRSLSGTGLGLSLAKAVARSHGGDIRVSSTPGTGSSFTLQLPLI